MHTLTSSVVQRSRNQRPFVITVKTDESGSSHNDQFIIPAGSGTYDYTICTSDGQNFTGETGSKTITFPSVGTYTIKIYGTFPTIYFNGGGDKRKLLSVEQWGNIVWESLLNSFKQCYNLEFNNTDIPNFSQIENAKNAFAYCTSANPNGANWDTSGIERMSAMFFYSYVEELTVEGWDVSNVKYMDLLFSFCDGNYDITSWDTSKVKDMEKMFKGASNFNRDLSMLDISLVEDMTEMFELSGLNTENYSKWLISCANRVYDGKGKLNVHLGGQGRYYNDETYTTSYSGEYDNAVDARAYLVLATGSGGAGWTITDAGLHP